jgi:hypothetical protein
MAAGLKSETVKFADGENLNIYALLYNKLMQDGHLRANWGRSLCGKFSDNCRGTLTTLTR